MVDNGLAAVRVLQRALGTRVRLERQRAGLSQRQLADQIGVTGPTISALENGHRGPSIEALCRLAAVLNVAPGVLLPTLEELNQLFSASASAIVNRVIRELDEEATR